MIKKQASPATPGRVEGSGLVSVQRSDHTPAPLLLQLAFLARRVGAMDAAVLNAIAEIAFSTTGAR